MTITGQCRPAGPLDVRTKKFWALQANRECKTVRRVPLVAMPGVGCAGAGRAPVHRDIVWPVTVPRWPGLFESAKHVKAARCFAELQRRAPATVVVKNTQSRLACQ